MWLEIRTEQLADRKWRLAIEMEYKTNQRAVMGREKEELKSASEVDDGETPQMRFVCLPDGENPVRRLLWQRTNQLASRLVEYRFIYGVWEGWLCSKQRR